MGVHADENIVEDAQIQEKAVVLKGPGHSPAGDLKGGQPHDVFSLVLDPPLGRSVDPGQKVEKSRFPGTIGSDQAHGLPAFDVEIHLVDRGQSPELDGKTAGG
jgi:hypothetical protein